MANWILQLRTAAADAVHIIIEVPQGLVVESLIKRGFRVYAINPSSWIASNRFSPAGAKAHSRDGWVLCDALRTDSRCFRALRPLDPILIELREWFGIAEELRHKRNRLSNRVRELLWCYCPHLLDLTDDVAAP